MGKSVEDLIKQLKHRKDDKRREAAIALGKLGDSRAVEPLIDAVLHDEKRFVRKDAILGLGYLGDRRAVEPLIQALTKDPKWVVREWAAYVLGQLGDEQAIEPLTRALKDESGDVVAMATEALGEFDMIGKLGETQVDSLIVSLKRDDSYARKKAAKALGETGDVRAIPALIQALKDESFLVRLEVAVSLGKLLSEEAAEPLARAALTDEVVDVRRAAKASLEKMVEQTVEPLVTLLFRTDHPGVLNLVVEMLIQRGGKQVVNTFIQALKTPSYELQKLAAEALGQLGDNQAVEPLIQAVRKGFHDVSHEEDEDEEDGDDEEDEEEVRILAVRSLRALKDKRAARLLVFALDDKSSKIRLEVVRTLKELGDNAAIVPLFKLFKDPEPQVRLELVKALEKLGGKQLVSLILPAFVDSDPEVVRRAAIIVGERGMAGIEELLQNATKQKGKLRNMLEAFAMLEILSEDESLTISSPAQSLVRIIETPINQNVLAYALLALGLIGNTGKYDWVFDRLLHFLKAENPILRSFAAQSLGFLGDKRAINYLLPLLTELEPERILMIRASRALIAIGEPALKPLLHCLRDSDRDVRFGGAVTLAGFGGLDVGSVVDIIKEPHEPFRVRLRIADPRIHRKHVLKPLKQALKKEEDAEVKEALQDAIEAFEGS